jgi:hypothetical protein
MAMIAVYLFVGIEKVYPLTSFQIPFAAISTVSKSECTSRWMFFMHTAPSSGRAIEFHEHHKHRVLAPGVPFHYTFIGFSTENTTDPPNIAMPENYLDWRRYSRTNRIWTIRFMAGFAWLFRYVLAHTTAHWIFVSDDDILINFDLLPAFMNELDAKHDPLNEVVVRGDCIVNGPVYPQGGSGVLLSRFAVKRLAPFGNYSIWGFWEGCPDMRLGHLMNEVFRGTSWYTSTAFLGSTLSETDFSSVRNGRFSGLPPCPNPGTLSQMKCWRFVAPVRQVIFFHIGTVFHNTPGWLKRRLAIAHNLWNAQQEVSFWPSARYSKRLCWHAGPNFTHFW